MYERLLILVPVLLSLSLHEFAHAFAADRLGDRTPREQGRLSLNPLRHLDPIGTLLIILVYFGWAKPVQTDPQNFRHPYRDIMLVALAGPAINLALAALFIGTLFIPGFFPAIEGQFFAKVLVTTLYFSGVVNVFLAVFNLLPIPPLDGSRVVLFLLPKHLKPIWHRFEHLGFIVVIGFVVLGGFEHVIRPLMRLFYQVVPYEVIYYLR